MSPKSVICDVSLCSNLVPAGRLMKYLEQCFSLKTYLRNVASVNLYFATWFMLVLNNDEVKDYFVGAGNVNNSFFVVSLSKVKLISVAFGKASQDNTSLVKGLNLAENFGPKENILVYTGHVLRDSLLGNKLPKKFLLLIAINPVEEGAE